MALFPLGYPRTRAPGQPSRSPPGLRRSALGLGVSLALCCGCDKGPALSGTTQAEAEALETPDLGSPDPKQRLGALLDRTPVYAGASPKAPVLGYLHAGATVARSPRSHENEHCTTGWYAVAPRGYVCTETAATINASHPTLLAMALGPRLEQALPYVYARTSKVTAVYKRSLNKGVELSGRLAKSTVMAIVGSWTAPDESLEPQRLGLRMDGRFVRADDLEPALGSGFHGMSLDADHTLPMAFVVRRGVRVFSLEGEVPEKTRELGYHDVLHLSGRFRTTGGERFYERADGSWVRHKDVTLVQARSDLPEFATGTQKWVDISVITGTLVAYEGTRPVYVTLVSVGRDRLGDAETTASTTRGTFRVVEKHITRRQTENQDDALEDAPWAMKLESGQWLTASPRHDRFGIEHTDGDVEVSPGDGAHLFRWATPSVPSGWHGVAIDPASETLIVNVRK
jgi:hypothetical protein